MTLMSFSSGGLGAGEEVTRQAEVFCSRAEVFKMGWAATCDREERGGLLLVAERAGNRNVGGQDAIPL